MPVKLVKRGAALVLLWAVSALPVLAEDIALVIGNRDYRDLRQVSGADQVFAVSGALRDADVTVVGGDNLSSREMRSVLAQFEQMAASADGLLVVLAGRFVQGGQDSYFLPVESAGVGLTGVPGESLPVSVVLQLLSHAPGRAVLVLATDDRGTEQGPFLSDGIGALDIPQGVSVLRGSPDGAARLVREVLSVPDAALDGRVARRAGMTIAGYAPQGHAFVGTAGRAGTADLSGTQARIDQLQTQLTQATRDAEAARAQAARSDAALAEAENVLWRAAQSQNSVDGYRHYLEVFPRGRFATQANAQISGIRDEPQRNARLAEEALGLSRTQQQEIQRDLSILGFNTRGIDGIFGPGTRSAVEAWQQSRGVARTGYLDREQIRVLAGQADDRAAKLRTEEQARAAELQRADDAYWNQLGQGQSEAGLRAYLERYPDGKWARTARTRLDDIEARQTPQLPGNEAAAWSQVRRQDTVAAYRAFLQQFPRGAFEQQARTRIIELQQPAGPSPEQAAAIEAENRLGLNSLTRRAVEQRLDALGLEPGPVDGEFDAASRRAIRRYQRNANLPDSGYLSESTVVRLLADTVRSILR